MRMAIIAITTNNSISVNPRRPREKDMERPPKKWRQRRSAEDGCDAHKGRMQKGVASRTNLNLHLKYVRPPVTNARGFPSFTSRPHHRATRYFAQREK